MVIQIYGGFVWSGFSLASANFLFDAVTPPKRARCVAYQGLVNGFFTFLGSLAGGYAAIHLPGRFSLGPWTWEPAFILPVIFLISGLIRLIATSILLTKFKEVRPVEPIGNGELIFRVSQIKPIAGATFSLFTGLFRDQRNGEIASRKDKPPITVRERGGGRVPAPK
jgi:MFS family permease